MTTYTTIYEIREIMYAYTNLYEVWLGGELVKTFCGFKAAQNFCDRHSHPKYAVQFWYGGHAVIEFSSQEEFDAFEEGAAQSIATTRYFYGWEKRRFNQLRRYVETNAAHQR